MMNKVEFCVKDGRDSKVFPYLILIADTRADIFYLIKKKTLPTLPTLPEVRLNDY